MWCNLLQSIRAINRDMHLAINYYRVSVERVREPRTMSTRPTIYRVFLGTLLSGRSVADSNQKIKNKRPSNLLITMSKTLMWLV